jgi:hypothetical protein
VGRHLALPTWKTLMIHPTDHPAFLIREWGKSLTPILYPFRDKRERWIEIRSCSVSYSPNKPETFDAKFAVAMKCALRWLDNEDVVCRRKLAKRGVFVQPIPDLDSFYSDYPEQLFSEEPGDVYDIGISSL